MGIDFSVVRAIFRKELAGYLVNPAGYVFLTLFIASTGAAAFLQEGFFSRNLADLAELNRVMPAILMLFVPAITMNAWSEERRAGTDELLLTLPVRDSEVIIGKYLGCLGVYTVALGFSLAHVGVLMFLGAPDPGLLFATYFGYWIVGAFFVAIGLLGSMFTGNATVAFILGVVACCGFVFAAAEPWTAGMFGCAFIAATVALGWFVASGESKGTWLAAAAGLAWGALLWVAGLWPNFAEFFTIFGVPERFYGFGQGILRLGDLLFFVGGTGVLLYLAGFLLGRRHW